MIWQQLTASFLENITHTHKIITKPNNNIAVIFSTKYAISFNRSMDNLSERIDKFHLFCMVCFQSCLLYSLYPHYDDVVVVVQQLYIYVMLVFVYCGAEYTSIRVSMCTKQYSTII